MSKALQSKAFPNAYLRIDGTGVSAPSAGGGGTVNCQLGVADFETFEERLQLDGTIAFASIVFPNVYIRMDGSGIGSPVDGGAGSVNCAFGVGAWEKFHKRPQSDGTVAFESAAFRGVYLRLDAQDVGELGLASGGGTVNCQFGVGAWEKFLEQSPPFQPIKWPSTVGTRTSGTVATTTAASSGEDADRTDDEDGEEEFFDDDSLESETDAEWSEPETDGEWLEPESAASGQPPEGVLDETLQRKVT